MLAIEVELLTGCYTATRYNNRNAAEWPPHPARLFSALVNAWAIQDPRDPDEEAALRWLEGLAGPDISASRWTDDVATTEVATRSVRTHFVPDNDPSAVRNLERTYWGLTEAYETVRSLGTAADEKAITKAQRALERAIDKARRDSLSEATKTDKPTSALELLPELRGKQARTYPTVRPADPVVVYTWGQAKPEPPIAAALDQLLGRVGRLGHSSSLVACRLVGESPPATYVPREDGNTRIRVTGPGQLDRLCELFETHQGTEPRNLPSRIERYGSPGPSSPDYPRSLWHDSRSIILALDGPMLAITDSLAIARTVRAALMRHADETDGRVPEAISGHLPRSQDENQRTGPTSSPHLAIVPLPYVGYEHADGLLKGVALLFPSACSDEDYQHLLRAVGQWTRPNEATGERSGRLWFAERPRREWRVTLPAATDRPWSAQLSRWTGPASRWATATPIVLDRYPDALWHGSPAKQLRGQKQASDFVADACTAIGLPRPSNVAIRPHPPTSGSRHVRQHPTFRSGTERAPRPLVHAVIDFHEPVQGPVIVGRGRYLGQGLCAPVPEPR